MSFHRAGVQIVGFFFEDNPLPEGWGWKVTTSNGVHNSWFADSRTLILYPLEGPVPANRRIAERRGCFTHPLPLNIKPFDDDRSAIRIFGACENAMKTFRARLARGQYPRSTPATT